MVYTRIKPNVFSVTYGTSEARAASKQKTKEAFSASCKVVQSTRAIPGGSPGAACTSRLPVAIHSYRGRTLAQSLYRTALGRPGQGAAGEFESTCLVRPGSLAPESGGVDKASLRAQFRTSQDSAQSSQQVAITHPAHECQSRIPVRTLGSERNLHP